MNNHYRPPRSGKRSLAVAVIVPIVLAAGAYVALDKPTIRVPSVVTPPDTAQRFTKSEPFYGPSPMPKAAPAVVVPQKSGTSRTLGHGIFKCEEANGAVTYSRISVRSRPARRHETNVRRLFRSMVDQRQAALTHFRSSSTLFFA